MILSIVYFILILILSYSFKKYKILSSYSGSLHQKFVNDPVTLSGGIFIFFPSMLLFFSGLNIIFIGCFSLIFFLGLLSDLNYLNKPKLRLFFQFLILVFFVLNLKVEVFPTRIYFIDDNFENTYISYFFTVFCLLILINGSNFIDGLNGLLLGYIVLILFFLIKLEFQNLVGVNITYFYQFVFLLLFILVLNYFNLLFLGDNGSYSLSFTIGYFLIIIYNKLHFISPYFIILLLWYPCFENLFSIIRKSIYKSDPLNADNKHLHHYLYLFVKSKFNLNKLLTNNLTSIFINLFNFIIFFIGSKYYSLTYIQILLILFCVTIYLLTYFILKKLVLYKI